MQSDIEAGDNTLNVLTPSNVSLNYKSFLFLRTFKQILRLLAKRLKATRFISTMAGMPLQNDQDTNRYLKIIFSRLGLVFKIPFTKKESRACHHAL